jgi:alpha-beta hydrolase superfamily lysophospholipase
MKQTANRNYEYAFTRFTQHHLQEEKDLSLNPDCYSTLLTHGHKVARSIILMHGMSNCPKQYSVLAPLFFDRGYNVLIPRLPYSGYTNIDTDALKHLTINELCECCETMVEIALGLGEHVTFLGISVGALWQLG